MRNRRWKGEKR